MFARQLIYLTRNLSLSRQPSINNKRILLGTVYSGNVHTKFYSMDHRDEPSSVKTGDNEHRRTEVIKLEMENLRNEGRNVPDADFIKAQHWNVLLTMNSRTARQKYYHFLYVTQKNKENQNIKKEQKSLAYAAFKERQKNEGAPPPKSRFLLRIYNQTMDRWRNSRLFRAMQFSEKIIFDCSYDQYMNRREANSLADQLQSVFSVNRLNRDPYDVHFCNVNFDGTTFKRLTSLIPTLRDETFPLNLHETSYLDVFPKEKLIYLTPHCKTDLTDYDADKVYIVGAMVDTSNHEPLSMMKAKELGIEMAKLPLDRYLDWGQGDKTLTLDQMMKIMLDWRATNSWEKALQHIPKRKIMQKDVTRPKEIGKWNANLNKFKPNSFDNDSDSTGPSTTEKFKRQPATNSQWSNKFKPNYGDENNSFDNESDSTGLSTAEKFKRQPVTTSQWSNKFDESPTPNFVSDRVDVKKPKHKQASGKSHVHIKKLFDDRV